MDGSHMKYLTPKSAHTLLKSRAELLDVQRKETLLQIVNFEIKEDWQFTPVSVKPMMSIEVPKHLDDNNSKTDIIYASSITNCTSNEIQDEIHSKATTKQVLNLSILSALIIVFF